MAEARFCSCYRSGVVDISGIRMSIYYMVAKVDLNGDIPANNGNSCTVTFILL